MGQKVNPKSLRLGVNRTWDSRWYAGKGFALLLQEDIKIRDFFYKRFTHSGISRVVIERPAKKPVISIFTARPGIIIGKKGEDIEKLRADLVRITKKETVLNVIEIRRPESDARLVAETIAQQIEKRGSHKRAMKKAIQTSMRMGIGGIRIRCSGRLGGAEIARFEEYREGRVPLHTLRADVDFHHAEAHTTYGVCGVKVWIFKEEILEHDPMAHERRITQRLG